MPDLTGRRFTAEVLRHQVDGPSIADVDDLTITAAIHRLREPAIRQALHHLDRVGLGYLRLIDLGPGPGRHGGQLLYQGRPANITGTPPPKPSRTPQAASSVRSSMAAFSRSPVPPL